MKIEEEGGREGDNDDKEKDNNNGYIGHDTLATTGCIKLKTSNPTAGKVSVGKQHPHHENHQTEKKNNCLLPMNPITSLLRLQTYILFSNISWYCLQSCMCKPYKWAHGILKIILYP